ncbi:MAG: hypothetical protein HN737_09725, partial [Desulfobacterales bacterium]|nr:hypothetical protein [Desulfobacterales bacterium]
GKYIISGDESNAPKLWKVGSEKKASSRLQLFRSWLSSKIGNSEPEIPVGKVVRTFGGYLQEAGSVSVSPVAETILTGKDGSFNLWNMVTGRYIKTIKHTLSGSNVTMSNDGKYAAAGGWDSQADSSVVKIWDTATGIEIQNLKKVGKFPGQHFRPLTITSDNKNILWSNGMNLILSDIVSGKEIKTFSDHKHEIKDAMTSADGRYAVSTDGVFLNVWDTSTGKVLKAFKGYNGAIGSDGKNVLLMALDIGLNSKTGGIANDNRLIIYLWNIKQKRIIRKLVADYDCSFQRGDWYFVKHIDSVFVSRDYKLALWADKENMTIHLWDILKGKELKTLSGHTNAISSIEVSPDWKYVYSSSKDGTTRIWDISTGKEIAQFINFTDGEWIVITPEGYYNSSANGDKYINVRIGNNVYGIDQYRSAFYKPRVVQAVLNGVNIEKAVARVIGKQTISQSGISSIRNIEPPFVVIKSPEDGEKINSTDAKITLYIEDRNQIIKKVKVFVNGRVVTGGDGRGFKVVGVTPKGKKTLDLKIPVQLDIGENLIEVTAFNGFSEGRKSIRIYSSVAKSKTILPNLWILSIGINRYQDKKLNSLSYAVADSEGIVKAFSGQKGKLFRKINALVINDSGPIKPTYENIIDNLNYLGKAGHNDVAMLFIAGHGMNDDRGEFYFLPGDAVIKDDGTIKRSKAISWREIKSVLDIPAKKLIFADTCHSEGVSGKKTRGVDSDRLVKELQEANAVIFTSSKGRELSQESDKWKHGAFTYALIEGIKGKADLIKDNKISMKELDTYVSETVPKITNGAQHPITNTPDGYVNFPVALVK